MSFALEYGYTSFHKHGEELCGDNVTVTDQDGYLTLVLADGMGSGVRASILSTLTSTMLCTMITHNVPIEETVETIADTLPVSKVNNAAYSTFSVIHVNREGNGYLFEFDNPRFIYYRGGRHYEPQLNELRVREMVISWMELHMQEDDLILVMSDGNLNAGTGMTLNYGWTRKEMIGYMNDHLLPGMSARCAASILASASDSLYMHMPLDDTSVAAVRYRREVPVNVMIGPSADRADNSRQVSDFLADEGLKAICGGTTAAIAAAYLDKEVIAENESADPEVPPISRIEGIDLVTEGVLTLQKLLVLSEEYLRTDSFSPKQFRGEDGASRLAELLFEEATTIRFFVGQAVNEAYQKLQMDSTLKFRLVDRLMEDLKKMGKQVSVRYY